MVVADVSKADEVESAVARTVGEFGGVDVLVANAAIQRHDRDKPVHELTEEAWDETQDVNLKGVFLTCRAGITHMLAQGRGGAIVIVSSVAALGGAARYSSYAASKGGSRLTRPSHRAQLRENGDPLQRRLPGRADDHAEPGAWWPIPKDGRNG